MSKEHENLLCSFCTKHRKDVRCLVLGPAIKMADAVMFHVAICDECTELASEIVGEERAKKAKNRKNSEINTLAEMNL